MADCRQCGAELPSITFGEASPYCKTCRSQVSAQSAPLSPESPGSPAQPIAAARLPIATIALLAINILIFIVMVASGVSFIDPRGRDVLRWGADYGPYTLGGQYWRLITSMFLHFGIIHLAGNMWCLWSLGQLTERLLGSISVLVLYLLTGIGASLLSLGWDPMRVSAGASGAIFGLAGALISVLYFGQLGLQPEGRRKLLGYVVRFAFINLVFGLTGHIDNMAHLGGLVTGLLMGLFLARTFNLAPEERPSKRRMIFVFSAVVLLALFVPVAKAKQYAVELGQGETALVHKDLNAAIAHLQKYVAARPDDPIGHTLLGSAFQEADRFNEAAKEYERSLEIEPDQPDAQIALASNYAYQKKTAKALELFARAMPSVEPDASTFYMYAFALKDAGRLPEAENKARRAIQLDPKYADAHTLLADILTLEGKKDEAAAERKRVEELDVDAATNPSSK